MKKEEVITNFNTLVNQQPLEIKDWIINTDRLLTDNGCKISSNGRGVFTYTSRKTNLRVCIIQMGDEGSKAFPYGRHFANDDNILNCLTESMLGSLSDGKNECTGCATKRPDLVGHNIRYTLRGKTYRRCHHKGFGFTLDNAEERKIIEKWLLMELAWS